MTTRDNGTMAFADIGAAVRSHLLVTILAFAVVVGGVLAVGASSAVTYSATAVIAGDAREKVGTSVQDSLRMTETLIAKMGPEMESSAFERAALTRVEPEFAADPTDVSVTPDTTVSTVTIESDSTSPGAAAAWANAWAEEATVQPTGSTLTRFRVLQVATVPTKPSSPGSAFYLVAAIFLGVLAAVIAALVAAGAARRREAGPNVLGDLGISVLGAIPPVKAFDKAARSGHAKAAPPEVREVVDGVAARLQIATIGIPEQTPTGLALAVVPIGKSDASAWLTTHLGRVLSTMTGVVACVDANLRDPLLDAYVGAPRSPGLADLGPESATDERGLGPNRVEELLHTVEPSLMLIPAGTLSHGAAIEVCATAIPRILDHLDQDGVTTLVRCPEAAAPETPILASEATHILLVLDATTSAARVETAVSELKTYCTVVGAVVVGRRLGVDHHVAGTTSKRERGAPFGRSLPTLRSIPAKQRVRSKRARDRNDNSEPPQALPTAAGKGSP